MADITEDELGDLSTIYWWLQGYLSSHTEEELPSEYLDTLSSVLDRHSAKELQEQELDLTHSLIPIIESGSFAYNGPGDYVEDV